MSRIAVLFGHKEDRRLLAERLRAHDYEVIAPDNPLALDEPYDLAILDTRALNSLSDYMDARTEAERPAFLPFLVVTLGLDTTAELQRGREAAYDFIVAPIQEAELLARVRTLLRARDLSLDLRKRSMELESVMEASPDLYFWLNDQYRITQYHARKESELYVGSDAFLGHTFEDFLPPEAAASMRAACESARATGKLASGECVLNMPDGDRTFEARVVSLPENQLLMIVRDVTDRVQAANALRAKAEDLARSNRELQQFVHVASHDLQEPLRMVTSYVQLLKQRYHEKLDDDADAFIQFAVDGAHRMQRLIDGLLEYSRVETRGKAFTIVDCEAALNEAVSNLQAAIDEAGVLVTHDPLPSVIADGVQMVQLLQHLIGNAIEFRRDEGPRVSVHCEQIDNDWVFSIRDNGIGIALEHQEQVFGAFERLHTEAEHPGTGIGLALCRRIVERHGGRMWVESEVGKGSAFFFAIPTRQGDMQ